VTSSPLKSAPIGCAGLPSEKAEQVTRALASVAQTRDFHEELRSPVEALVPESRRAAPERAEPPGGEARATCGGGEAADPHESVPSRDAGW